MNQTIISTVGTSLLGNAKRYGYPKEAAALQQLLREKGQEACAEANALSRLASPGDDLVFLHSDTEDGLLCASMLAGHFAEKGYSVRAERITGLSHNEKGFVSHGLRDLVRLLAGEIRGAARSGKPAHLSATGGFKVEIAYATILGLLFKVPVSYIHETFKDIITLPPTPIGWDYRLFIWHGNFFEWIDAEPRPTAEVERRLAALPEAVAMLLENADDGCTYLSPMGEVYLEAFREEKDQGRPLLLSAEAKKTLNAQPPSVQEGLMDVLHRLRLGEDWQRSAETLSGGVSKFPKGHTLYRAFVVEREGKLYVLELSGHHDERRYQQLMQTIRWSQYEGSVFTDFFELYTAPSME